MAHAARLIRPLADAGPLPLMALGYALAGVELADVIRLADADMLAVFRAESGELLANRPSIEMGLEIVKKRDDADGE